VLKQVAELLLGPDPQVDLQARMREDACRHVPATASLRREAVSRERLCQGRGVVRRGDQVEVLAGLGPPAGRAGDLDSLRHPHLHQVAADLVGDRQDAGQQQPLADAVLGDPLE
jgi:hypothetical protein